MQKLTFRPLTTADAPALTALLAAAEKVDDTGENYSEGDIAEELADDSLDLERDTLGAVTPDGALVGYVALLSARTVRDVDRIHLDGVVLPSARRSGLGTRLLSWASERGTALHQERHPSAPGSLLVSVPGTVPGKEAMVRAAGFEPVRWWYTMRRRLGSLPAVPPLPGLTIVPYDRRFDEQVRLAHGSAFADHWGSTPPDRQRWEHHFTGSRAFRPTISWLALDGDTVAGYLLAYFWEAAYEVTGEREAYIGQIGTLRDHRRRGVGAALLATALAGFAAEGYDSSELTVDTSNPTGALGLYERAGFEVDRRSMTWGKPIA